MTLISIPVLVLSFIFSRSLSFPLSVSLALSFLVWQGLFCMLCLAYLVSARRSSRLSQNSLAFQFQKVAQTIMWHPPQALGWASLKWYFQLGWTKQNESISQAASLAWQAASHLIADLVMNLLWVWEWSMYCISPEESLLCAGDEVPIEISSPSCRHMKMSVLLFTANSNSKNMTSIRSGGLPPPPRHNPPDIHQPAITRVSLQRYVGGKQKQCSTLQEGERERTVLKSCSCGLPSNTSIPFLSNPAWGLTLTAPLKTRLRNNLVLQLACAYKHYTLFSPCMNH